MSSTGEAMTALLEIRLRQQDPRFVPELLSQTDSSVLATVAEQWTAGAPTPWTSGEARRYLLLRRHQLGHEIVVRRLIDFACRERLGMVLAPAMSFVDESTVRQTRFRLVSNRQIFDRYLIEKVSPPRLPNARRMDKKLAQHFQRGKRLWRLFSLPTRRFLQNQLWRGFREIATADIQSNSSHYVEAAGDAIRLYPDELIQSNPSLLQCRGLLRLAFRHHPALKWTSRRVHLREKKTLERLISDLAPADVGYVDLWSSESGRRQLARIAAEARSNLMRAWADRMRNVLHFE